MVIKKLNRLVDWTEYSPIIHGIYSIWNLHMDTHTKLSIQQTWTLQQWNLPSREGWGKQQLSGNGSKFLPHSYQNKFQVDQKFLKVVNIHSL